jgi:hypothetical protein
MINGGGGLARVRAVKDRSKWIESYVGNRILWG